VEANETSQKMRVDEGELPKGIPLPPQTNNHAKFGPQFLGVV